MNNRNFARQPDKQVAHKLPLLGCILVAVSLFLPACNFPNTQPTRVPFEATPYQPGSAGTVASPAAPISSAETATLSTTSTATDTTATDTTATDTTATDTTATDTTATDSTATDSTATTNRVPAQPAAEATAAPQAVAAIAPEVVRYSGEIAAEHQIVVVAETAGMVLELPLQVGDVVAKGDLVAQLDTTLLEAQKAQAMVGLEAATAQLALIQIPPDEDDLAAAQAAVNAASAAYQRASAGLTPEEERLVLAQLKQAQAAVTVAQAAYNQVKGNPAIGMMPQSLQLQQATLAVEAAQAQYDKAVIGATQDVIAGAYAQLAQARAQLQRLREGAKPEQIKAVEAQVKQAEMGVYLAQLQISKATVKAAVDGVVSRVNSAEGSMAAPGAPLVTLLSRDIKITVAVEEARLRQLRVGLPALIRVDAYPDLTFAGEIAIIAPELDPSTRTVQVTIRPTEDAGVLAPGMFATVELQLQ
jgi:multidrug efflux pump subunit AcrA (membrane-fusion protein)